LFLFFVNDVRLAVFLARDFPWRDFSLGRDFSLARGHLGPAVFLKWLIAFGLLEAFLLEAVLLA
jgi:hypothetical protein